MKDRKMEMDEGKITGFFDKDSEFNGELTFRGSFRIDGNFKGKIESEVWMHTYQANGDIRPSGVGEYGQPSFTAVRLISMSNWTSIF